jgi:hypothetical protein
MLGRALRVFREQLRSDDPWVSLRAARSLLQMTGSGRFAPGPAPTDALGVIDAIARQKRVERLSEDPREARLSARDRLEALRDLKSKRQLLAQQEQGPPAVEEQVGRSGEAQETPDDASTSNP